MIENCIDLTNENDEVSRFPFISLVMFSLVALIYYLSSDLLLMAFCFCLAIAAYTDACKRWIPDFIIYLLLAISIYSLHSKVLLLSLFSLSFYITPVVLLSIYGYVVKKESWIASGDYYVFPSIGLMLSPEYAAGTMLATLAIMLVLMRWIKQIPLITVAYFTFTGFNICLLSGYL
ncbi:prepilin peptidase [Citrobacter sp. NCU1]|uniref:prepilin peptidase n=1 Tax=Citrobacter sp. NCU1 TaxID=2026683 RepID=UPI001390B760|nr:prepilin peptidase [Citrobacter sp. NCU1]